MTHLSAIAPVLGNHYRLAWLVTRIHRMLSSDAVGVEVVDDTGRTLGMAAFEQWCGNSVGVHVAIESPIALRYAKRVLADVLQTRRIIWCMVEEDGRSNILARRLGFQPGGVLPRAGAQGQNVVLLYLKKE